MQIFGSNTPAIVQYLLAFVIILGVLAVFVAVLRRITNSRPRLGYASTSARHRQQRLGVVDAVDIDAQRQLLLLRRDNVEHLVLIGGPNDLLVESGIGRLPYRTPVQPPQHAPLADSTDGDPAPHDPLAVAAEALDVPPPLRPPLTPPPRSLATPVAPRATTGAAAGAVLEGLGGATSAAERGPAVESARAEAQHPFSAPGSVAGDIAAPVLPPAPPPPAREPRKGPFSTVARQLEEALKRPFSAVRPSSVTGIDLDTAEPGTASTDSASVPVPPAPPPPAQATLPVPPLAPGRAGERPAPAGGADSGPSRPLSGTFPEAKPAFGTKPVFDTKPAVEAKPEATEAKPGVDTKPVFEAKPLPDVKPSPAFDRGPEVKRPAETEPVAKPVAKPVDTSSVDTPAGPAPVAHAVLPGAPDADAARPAVESPAPAVDAVRDDESAPVTPAQAPAAPVLPDVPFAPPPRRETPPAAATAPSDTFKVPEALKATPGTPSAPPASTGAFDLSSLENIEAEFARLLGRAAPKKND